jgi:Protein of unknown function (DUF2809)
MPLVFNPKYLLLTAILFAVEVCIALFVKDAFVRPFVGDALVVILIYCFLKIFLDITFWKIALGVFLFACVIEILQYFDYVARLGLENNRALSVILGRTFEPIDFAAYFTGFLFIIFAEKILNTKKL